MGILYYLICAMFTAWVYKSVVGLLSGAVAFVFMLIFKIKADEVDYFFVKHPKKLMAYSVLLNTTIGTIYSAIIAYFTLIFIGSFPGINYWAFTGLSLFWGLTIVAGSQAMNGTLLSSCLLSLILIYFGFGYWGPIITFILISLASMAYFFGRADVVKDNFEEGIYDEHFRRQHLP